MRFQTLVFTVVIVSQSLLPLMADEPPVTPKQALIAQLMEMVQPIKMGQRMREQVMGNLVKQRQSLSPLARQVLDRQAAAHNWTPEQRAAREQEMLAKQQASMEKFNKLFEEELKDIDAYEAEIIPKLYDKYYTEAEIQDLVNFYKTPTGQKFLNTETDLVHEATEMSSQLIKKKTDRVMERMMAETSSQTVPPPASR